MTINKWRKGRVYLKPQEGNKYFCIYCWRGWKKRSTWKKHMLTTRGTLRKKCPHFKAPYNAAPMKRRDVLFGTQF